MGQADSHCPPRPYYVPGHHAKHLKCIIAAHYTFKYIKYTIALQSPQQLPGWYSLPQYWGTIFKHRNSTSELLLFCRSSHKSQFSSPAWASLRPLPHAPPALPTPPTGRCPRPGRGSRLQRVGRPAGAGEERGTAILLTPAVRSQNPGHLVQQFLRGAP